jgi:PAS domain S-box-containing protein
MCLAAPDGRFLQANRPFCHMVGRSEQDLLAGSWDDLTHPDDVSMSRAVAGQLLGGQAECVAFEKRYVGAKGNVIWARVRTSLIRDHQGYPSQFITHIEDITESKRAAEIIRLSQERVRLLLDSTAEAIYGIDLNGDCTFANSACLRMLGHAGLDALIGKNMHALIHHSHADGSPYPAERCPIHQALRSEQSVHTDDQVLWRADGTSFPPSFGPITSPVKARLSARLSHSWT